MGTVYFGVDCARDSREVIAAAIQAYGAFPSWFGRYLTDGGAGATVLSPEERDWLHANNARILLCYNGAGPGHVAADRATGVQHGRAAAAIAKSLGAPGGVWLPVDIEAGWYPSAQFLAGYLGACHAAGYVGGAYLNCLEDTHTAPWRAARGLTDAGGYVWSSEPEYNAWRSVVRSDWFDFTTTPMGARAADVACHQYSEGELGDLVDLDVCTDTCYHTLLWAPGGQRRKAIAACGLKPQPAHGGPDLATIPAGGQLIDSGKRSGDWASIQWRDLYGWILTANITDL